MKSYLGVIVFFLFLIGPNFNIQAQNLIINPEFEADGGSFNSWGTASGTSLGTDGSDHYAILHGENGVLYQRVADVVPGKTYQCTMYFKNLKVKQTTGYGYAIESGTSLILPEFTIGATNLRSFCQDNSGTWTTLENNLLEQNVSKSYNILIPENTTAIYICLGTKGAVADMQVDSVVFKQLAATKVSFFVKNKETQEPLKDADIQVDGFSNLLITDAAGEASAELVASSEPISFTVNRNWFKTYESEVTVGETDLTVTIEMDSIEEVKSVETRISKYGDNATPYPLFGHFWSSGLNYSDAITDSITGALDYIVGGGGLENSKTISDKLHQCDPKFQVIRYQGGWDIKAAAADDQKMDLLYYRCGILSADVSALDETFILNTTPDNKGLGLVASEDGNFTTWIRMGNELMKIISVSGSSYPLTVTVERGYSGTTAEAHQAGTTSTSPLYSTIPVPGGNNSNLSYFDPVFGTRKSDLLENALAFTSQTNQDGIWIDILVGLLGAQNVVGGNYTLWNHAKEEVFSNIDIIKATKDALDDIYNIFYSRMGYYPAIYGNNVLYSTSLNPGDRAYVMVKDVEHTRVLDGFCHENSWGHMNDNSGNIDNDGNPVTSDDKYIALGANGHYLEWYMGNTWIDHCKAITLLAEDHLPNQPMTINAGYKNQWFAADLSDQVRYDFNKFAYASYLLCVDVTADSLISCRMGISPEVVNNGQTSVDFQPFFYYPIGVPTQSFNASSFTQYQIGSHRLYARQFSNGIVLVNPFSKDMDASVAMSEIAQKDGVYIDPENDSTQVSSVLLKSRESKILLMRPSTTSVNQNIKKEQQGLIIYPVPAKDRINIKMQAILSKSAQACEVKIYNHLGENVKDFKSSFDHGTVSINIGDLRPGFYFVRIPGVKAVGKFIKCE